MNFLLSNNHFIKHAGSLYQKINVNVLPGGGIEATLVAKFALFIAAILFTTIVIGKILKIFKNLLSKFQNTFLVLIKLNRL